MESFVTSPPVCIPKTKLFLVFFITSGVFVILCLAGLGFYGSRFYQKVLPGTMLGDIPIGGLTAVELEIVLRDIASNRWSKGIEVQVSADLGSKVFLIPAKKIEDGGVQDFFVWDIPKEINGLIDSSHSSFSIRRGALALYHNFYPVTEKLYTVSTADTIIRSAIPDEMIALEKSVRNAAISKVMVGNDNSFKYTIRDAEAGIQLDMVKLLSGVQEQLENASTLSVKTDLRQVEPLVKAEDIDRMSKAFGAILQGDPIKIIYVDPNKKRDFSWTLFPERLSQLITIVKKDGAENLAIASEVFSEYVADVIAPTVDIAPRNARLTVGHDSKVEQFISSQAGVTTDVSSTVALLNDIISARVLGNSVSSTVNLATTVVAPDIATGAINDLGISEILGVGYSNYSGSPTNRIKNVRLAVKEKLNGLLVKPDETFSLLKTLEPFTVAGGYLPELVIKGNEIKPEIGGGLCQVGSTMFRAVMNSGLPVVERRNHSIVVSYYNDHRNNKPGVDATIYDPAPDFKFLNDTGHYILITTEMNEKTSELWFTFWGTNDGRKGYYTEPTVDKWIPYGEDSIVETTTLDPGVKKCQAAHTGAIARFTYIREFADGVKKEEEFVSQYRALPRICLIGVAKDADSGVQVDPLSGEVVVPDIATTTQ